MTCSKAYCKLALSVDCFLYIVHLLEVCLKNIFLDIWELVCEHNVIKTELEWLTGHICEGWRRLSQVKNNPQQVSHNRYLITYMQSQASARDILTLSSRNWLINICLKKEVFRKNDDFICTIFHASFILFFCILY